MYYYKLIWNFLILVNCFWVIPGAIPLPKDDIGQNLTSINISEEVDLTALYKDDFNPTLNSRSDLVRANNNADWPIFDERFDMLPQNCSIRGIPSNCDEATVCTKQSGYYYLKFPYLDNQVFLVECDAQEEGGGWMVIQRRIDGSEDFYRTWSEYKAGFGNIAGEHFIGLDKLHVLTNYGGPQELLVLMEKQNGQSAYARFDLIVIANESENYKLKSVGNFTGTAGDSLRYHVGAMFSTRDQDNDSNSNIHCAVDRRGAWWYKNCAQSNLNGLYGGIDRKGIEWNTFDNKTSLKTVTMMIRRRRH